MVIQHGGTINHIIYLTIKSDTNTIKGHKSYEKPKTNNYGSAAIQVH